MTEEELGEHLAYIDAGSWKRGANGRKARARGGWPSRSG
jgi:hypothetical protein